MIENFKFVKKNKFEPELEVPIYLVDPNNDNALNVIIFDNLHADYRLVNLNYGETEKTEDTLIELYNRAIKGGYIEVKLDITATEI